MYSRPEIFVLCARLEISGIWGNFNSCLLIQLFSSVVGVNSHFCFTAYTTSVSACVIKIVFCFVFDNVTLPGYTPGCKLAGVTQRTLELNNNQV